MLKKKKRKNIYLKKVCENFFEILFIEIGKILLGVLLNLLDGHN